MKKENKPMKVKINVNIQAYGDTPQQAYDNLKAALPAADITGDQLGELQVNISETPSSQLNFQPWTANGVISSTDVI